MDVRKWLSENNIPIVETTQDGTGTKYKLATCPWNSAHGESAAIFEYKSGKVAAGCSHPECKNFQWRDLKRLYQKTNGCNSTPADELTDHIENECDIFCNQFGEAFVIVTVDRRKQTLQVKSSEFQTWVRFIYRKLEKKTLSREQLNRVIETVEMLAATKKQRIKTALRIITSQTAIYYDLLTPGCEIVKIHPQQGVSIQDNSDCTWIFEKNADIGAQVIPNLASKAPQLPELLRLLFRVDEKQRILFMVYLVSAFVPDICHPILLLHGEKGAAKSSTLRLISRLISPCVTDLIPLPKIQDLPAALTGAYFCAFDNLRLLTHEISDMLCMSVTGGWIKKRRLFTDNGTFCCNLKKLVALDGINLVANQPDLLDRSIIIELQRISDNERLTDTEVNNKFSEYAPNILGSCFDALAKALALYPTVTLNSLPRMADFAKFGWCIAESVEQGYGDEFLKQYKSNIEVAATESTANSMLIECLLQFLNGQSEWSGSVSQLYTELTQFSRTLNINTLDKSFPKAANVLSKRLNEYKTDLERIGIFFEIRHSGQFKSITIHNNGTTI